MSAKNRKRPGQTHFTNDANLIGHTYPEVYAYKGTENERSYCKHLIEYLHNLKPVTTSTVSLKIDWDSICLKDSVSVSLNSIKSATTAIPVFSSTYIDCDLFINTGNPIRALDFSGPFEEDVSTTNHQQHAVEQQRDLGEHGILEQQCCDLLGEQSDVGHNKQYSLEEAKHPSRGGRKRRTATTPLTNPNNVHTHELFSVLAVGTSSWTQPLTKAVFESQNGPGIIQLWKVSKKKTSSIIRMGLIHNGAVCKSLSWVRHSQSKELRKIGLLFATLGDGSIVCYSIPAEPFLDNTSNQTSFGEIVSQKFCYLPPIWHSPPSAPDELYFTCVSPAPHIQVADVRLSNLDSKHLSHGSATLRVAAGCKDGRVLIWRFSESEKSLTQFSVYLIHDRTVISSIAWAPLLDLPLIATSSIDGKVRIWDTRYPVDGLLYEIEGVKRPMHHVCWSPIARFIFACHVTALIFNSTTKECSQRLVGKNTSSNKTFGTERPPWCCASLGNLALFAFDGGSLLMHPVDKLDRKSHAISSIVTWAVLPSTLSENENSVNSEQSMVVSEKSAGSTVDPLLLTKFYGNVERLYTQVVRNARNSGLLISFGKDYVGGKNGASKVKVEDGMNSLSAHVRLHSVATLDVLVYPQFEKSYVACGSDCGVLHVFSPSDKNLC